MGTHGLQYFWLKCAVLHTEWHSCESFMCLCFWSWMVENKRLDREAGQSMRRLCSSHILDSHL